MKDFIAKWAAWFDDPVTGSFFTVLGVLALADVLSAAHRRAAAADAKADDAHDRIDAIERQRRLRLVPNA